MYKKKYNPENSEKTAWITGASSGIGREFALRLAERGYRLILTARRRERLEEIAAACGVPCEIIAADLSDTAECRRVCDTLSDKKIDVFINNAGFGTCGRFTDTDLDKEMNMIKVNISAMHYLCKEMLRKMEAQKHGIILNVASSAGLLPAGPYMAAYYASKSYVVSLTRAIAQELKESKSPVYVCALCPGPVDTEFNEHSDVQFALSGISAELCVKEAFRGMKKRKTIIVPTALMRFVCSANHITPYPVLLPIVAKQQKRKQY